MCEKNILYRVAKEGKQLVTCDTCNHKKPNITCEYDDFHPELLTLDGILIGYTVVMRTETMVCERHSFFEEEED